MPRRYPRRLLTVRLFLLMRPAPVAVPLIEVEPQLLHQLSLGAGVSGAAAGGASARSEPLAPRRNGA